jgi:hypothetical protein
MASHPRTSADRTSADRTSADRTSADRTSADRVSTDDPAIDALYGLEPPIERDAGQLEGSDLVATPIDCPYCGERFETLIDPSAGSAAYIEDCQVCCQPIELTVRVDEDGAVAAVSAARGD